MRFVLVLLLLVLTFSKPGQALADGSPFPVLPGLQDTVAFWKQIFTRYSIHEVVFYDPRDPVTIYSVLRIPENDYARATIEKQRLGIMAEYDLNEEDGRVRGQRGAKEQFLLGLKIAGRYVQHMQKIFRKEGVPIELTYLPMVESAFNVRARSTAGAVGMWQFMPETGKKFLRVAENLDERRDPFASTTAAARLLRENYQILGNWPLAITAYNHGTEGILRAISTVGSRNLVDIIQRYESPRFGYASKNFYAEFLAVLDIINRKDAFFPALRFDSPVTLQEIEIKTPLPLERVLKPAGIATEQFFEWNPALISTSKTIPAGYNVRLPPKMAGRFLTAKQRFEEGPAARRPTRLAHKGELSVPAFHRVSAGETLVKIAARYRTSVAALRQANSLSGSGAIAAGQRLKIPSPLSSPKL